MPNITVSHRIWAIYIYHRIYNYLFIYSMNQYFPNNYVKDSQEISKNYKIITVLVNIFQL